MALSCQGASSFAYFSICGFEFDFDSDESVVAGHSVAAEVTSVPIFSVAESTTVATTAPDVSMGDNSAANDCDDYYDYSEFGEGAYGVASMNTDKGKGRVA
jgi:D-serine deaminase-like pyridoxal phosphate-dependent protein